MMTKEEILEKHFNLAFGDKDVSTKGAEAIYAAMEEYAQQEVEAERMHWTLPWNSYHE